MIRVPVKNISHGRKNKMKDNEMVLCASSAYEEKYYFNERYHTLPQAIKEEVQILCVLFTTDVGGILTLEFEEDGTLLLQVSSDEGDLLYDEIGSALKIKEIQRQKIDLLEALELYYKTFFLGEKIL